MDFKDFIDDKFCEQDPYDLKSLIDFLEKNENHEKLFQFWKSLENYKMPALTSDAIYEEVIEGIENQTNLCFLTMKYISFWKNYLPCSAEI